MRRKRIMLEVALIKLCTPAMETKQDTILRADPCGGRKSGKKAWRASANMQGQIVYVTETGADRGGSVINGNTEGNLQALVRKTANSDAIPRRTGSRKILE